MQLMQLSQTAPAAFIPSLGPMQSCGCFCKSHMNGVAFLSLLGIAVVASCVSPACADRATHGPPQRPHRDTPAQANLPRNLRGMQKSKTPQKNAKALRNHQVNSHAGPAAPRSATSPEHAVAASYGPDGADYETSKEQASTDHPVSSFQSYYDSYYCEDPGYNCDYYDYGVNLEGTGQLGIVENVLLQQINALANLTPRLGARARGDTAAAGRVTTTRRNTTVVIQNRPSRTAALYTTGGVAIDPKQSTALSAGTGTAVAKNIVAIGFPVNNYASSGESFVLVNSSSATPGFDSAVRTLSGGLAVAGSQAIATTSGTFNVGPVIGIFNAGNRAGASSQNGVVSQTIGTNSASYLQVSSLGVVSPGNPAFLKQLKQQNKTKDGYSQDNQAVDSQADHEGQEGLSYQDHYQDYYDEERNPGRMNNAGGAVSKAWLQHRDLVSQPINTVQTSATTNTRADAETFGASNGFGWSRGVSQTDMLAAGTRNAGARLRTGAFGTGASTLTATVSSVTPLKVIKCMKPKAGRKNNTASAYEKPAEYDAQLRSGRDGDMAETEADCSADYEQDIHTDKKDGQYAMSEHPTAKDLQSNAMEDHPELRDGPLLGGPNSADVRSVGLDNGAAANRRRDTDTGDLLNDELRARLGIT